MNKRISGIAAVVAVSAALIALHTGGAIAAPPRDLYPTPTRDLTEPRCHLFGTCLTPSPAATATPILVITPFVPPIDHPPCYGCITVTPEPTRIKPMFEGGPTMYMPVLMLGK